MLIDITKMPFRYWDDITLVSYLQRRIIVYSVMYYNMNESCISDREYDQLSKQLVQLQGKLTKQQLQQTQYGYMMYDFDGTTGFDLPYRLNDVDKCRIEAIAHNVYKQWKGAKQC